VASKKSFPDLNKDGKVTKADILKGRGVKGFKEGGSVRRPAPTEKPSSDDPLMEALEQERRIQEANPKPKSPKPDADDRRFKSKKRTEEQIEKREKRTALEEKSENHRRSQRFAEGGMVRGCKGIQIKGKNFSGTY